MNHRLWCNAKKLNLYLQLLFRSTNNSLFLYNLNILCTVVPGLEEISGKLNQTLPPTPPSSLALCPSSKNSPVHCTLELLGDSPGPVDAVQLVVDSMVDTRLSSGCTKHNGGVGWHCSSNWPLAVLCQGTSLSASIITSSIAVIIIFIISKCTRLTHLPSFASLFLFMSFLRILTLSSSRHSHCNR